MLESGIDGFGEIPEDRYDYAAAVADDNGRDEPNQDDEFEGFVTMIDAAIAEDYPDWEPVNKTAPEEPRNGCPF